MAKPMGWRSPRGLLVFMAVLLVCLILGILFDAPLKEMADAAHPENPAKAPWYFLGLQEMVSYSAFMGGLVIPTVVMIGLALVPYLDTEPEDTGVYLGGASRSTTWRTALFSCICSVLAVAIPVRFGWLRSWFPEIPQLVIILLNPGTLLTAAFVAWSLWIPRRSGSTRQSAVALFTCFMVGFVILTFVGMQLRGPNWDFYWTRSAWPAH